MREQTIVDRATGIYFLLRRDKEIDDGETLVLLVMQINEAPELSSVAVVLDAKLQSGFG
jgi:hypothetical protein